MIKTIIRYNSSSLKTAIKQQQQQQQKPKFITSNYRKLKSHYNTPKYPIVLCHGFSGFDKLTFIAKPNLALNEAIGTAKDIAKDAKDTIKDKTPGIENSTSSSTKKSFIELDYWSGIKEALTKLGSTVFIAKVPAFGKIKDRAISLDKFITKQCKILRKSESKSSIYNKDHPNQHHHNTFKNEDEPIKINLISHSMGGLDSRYLISKIHNNSKSKIYKIVSLTTISTPHHGSEVADFIVENLKDLPILKSICPESIEELTTKQMIKFNENVPNDPTVKYFSFGARFNPHWYNLFNLTWQIMNHEIIKNNQNQNQNSINPSLLDNDGLVSVESSKWGKYIGTLDQVDHLDLINWTNKARLTYDKIMWAENPPFNAIALYLDIADKLAKNGL
ncbi:TGL2 [Candida pseudojiufengensis]|uniref:TGL2 n=1 Tax=Candida pseudojiufengensis TaxID=497109 RepID=UPI002224D340|nr:TGL2 [Candida pseudojiufengensis]KAI5966264.1 TGL2 [Candida pseudojiufengensis]